MSLIMDPGILSACQTQTICSHECMNEHGERLSEARMFEIREYIDDTDRVTKHEVVNILQEMGEFESAATTAGKTADIGDDEESEQKLQSALGDIKAKVENRNYAGNNDEELDFVRELERIERQRRRRSAATTSGTDTSESSLERELDEGVFDAISGDDSAVPHGGLDPTYFDDLSAEEAASINRIREQDRQMLLKQQEKAAKAGSKASGGWSSGFLSKPAPPQKVATKGVSFAEAAPPRVAASDSSPAPALASSVKERPLGVAVKERPFGDVVRERPFAKRN